MSTLLSDVRAALRGLVRHPRFALTALITLALGIGATTAVFSVVHAVLLRPLPYSEPERLVALWERNEARRIERHPTGPAIVLRWSEQSRTLEGISPFYDSAVNLAGQGEPERVPAGTVGGAFFTTLGVPAALGRVLTPADDEAGPGSAVVLSDAYWKRRFGADPKVIGSRLTVDGAPATVVGVLPAGFRGPFEAALWLPIGSLAAERDARYRYFTAVARLRDGVTLDQARAEMARVSRSVAAELPEIAKEWEASLIPLHDDLVGDVRDSLVVLLAAVGLVLLIACANVANLLLARAVARRKELAVRCALGASRGRLVRLALIESVALALLGGLAGGGLAVLALRGLGAGLPDVIAAARPAIDGAVLAFTLGVCLVTGVLFGLVPALGAHAGPLNETLKEGGRGSGQLGRSPRLRSGLVVAEVSLAVMLLVGAGLLVRSLGGLLGVDPGFVPDGVLTAEVHLPAASYPQPDDRRALLGRLLGDIDGQGGMRAAAASYLPVDGIHSVVGFWPPEGPGPESGMRVPAADLQVITPGLLELLRVRRQAGRGFEPADDERGRRVIIVNETLARATWPGENPVGKRLSVAWMERFEAEVVGVVADVRLASLSRPARNTLYVPFAQMPFETMRVMVAGAPPATMATAVRERLAALDSALPVADVRTLAAVVDDSLGQTRFAVTLLGGFAAVALLLACIGLYGVLAQLVAQREAEFGVRMAVGASAADVVRLVLGRSLVLCGSGALLGVLGAIALARAMSSLLFGVGMLDPISFIAAPVVLVAAGMLASGLPAGRAAAVAPATALRAQ